MTQQFPPQASGKCWQVFTHSECRDPFGASYNDHGNWTALFQTGQALNVPPQLQSGTYLFPGMGYDGQFYRYVAHDPFFGGGLRRFIDSPTRRYRRILMPALAFFLAAGRQQWIDGSYIAVSALFVLLGAYWLSRWASLHGFHAAWALAVPLIPATLISADRMTVDGALAALTVGAAYFTATRQTTKLYLLLVMACLVRETGPFLLGGCILFELQARRFARSAVWATAALPALMWYWFVSRNVPGVRNLSGIPSLPQPRLSGGIFKAILRPAHYPFSAGLETFTRSLDAVAVCAIVCASLCAILAADPEGLRHDHATRTRAAAAASAGSTVAPG